jgi:3-hydroxyisobutyrate dehydrogenase
VSTIAFIGLGNMGGPMAANLVKAGHRVVGYDVSGPAIESAVGAGVEPARTIAAVVAGAEVVITMLPAGTHVLAVWPEILQSTPSGTLLIDSSTIDVASARSAHEMARERGCLSLDAPVSGGTGGARQPRSATT